METVMVSNVSGWPGKLGLTAQLPVEGAHKQDPDLCVVIPRGPLISASPCVE